MFQVREQMLPILSGELDRARTLSGAGRDSLHAETSRERRKELKQFSLIGRLLSLFPEIEQQLTYAGINPEIQRRYLLRIFVIALLPLVAAIVFSKPALIIAIPLYLIFERMTVKRRAEKRAQEFEKDYTALLLSLASAIRTGLDPLSALSQSHQLFSEDSAVRREVMEFKDSIERGVPEERALANFARTINHPDISQFRTAMILARREGSSLSICLERLARVTRHRQSFRRKVRAAIAMQKMSALGIAGCTVVIGIIQFSSNPQAMRDAMAHPVGAKMLSAGLALIVAGLFWMRKIAQERV